MANAADIVGTVQKHGSAILLARVVGADGSAITQASISGAKYTIYRLDDSDPDREETVAGHEDVDLTDSISSIVFDTLQTDDLWDVDATGYNFKHVLDVSSDAAFPERDRSYRIVFELTPASGQVILVRFRLHAI